MKKDYTNLKMEDLLHDAFFTETIQHPTEETDLFWKMQVEDGVIDKREYHLAVLYLKSIQVEHARISKKDLNSLWKSIEQTNKKVLKIKIKRLYRVLYAACLVLLIGTTGMFYYMAQITSDSHIMEIAELIKPKTPTEEVQLLITDKKPILITETESDIRYEQTGKLTVNEKIIKEEATVSQTDAPFSEKPLYSQLIVPKGKRSTLTFSDGTSLWVNAGSRVIYPEKFDAKKREIYVDGEVFLQVSPNKDCPFIVKTKKMDIQVLGTSFNVMAYEEDKQQSVVLVEGEVKIKSDNKEQTYLTPNDQFLYKEGKTEIKKVDATDYTSWKDGYYKSRSETLPCILDRLSRYYGKEIYYEPNIENVLCTGKLDLKDDLDLVLSWLTSTAPVNYELKNGCYFVYAR
ncbi:FecR family protein [Parabacteroides sp. BX2]|jgi:hypothetical protein|uniref:FecR family protein n=1 Tax=Parabacteroides segnis TaxID=2763058 RepID=A0ABR7DW36_9BACT|nr:MULTISPECIES: FecR family protein [Parabacteroides]MBC5641648.1 FecR family protein [Parabacteroides segnis]MCM0711456.1 FecR family protein [Parabacteroides sp. TA-V-105]